MRWSDYKDGKSTQVKPKAGHSTDCKKKKTYLELNKTNQQKLKLKTLIIRKKDEIEY